MGGGLPYAIAAALAYPGPAGGGDRRRRRPVDERRRTGDLRALPAAGEDRRAEQQLAGQIKWEQMLFLGNPEFGCDLQPVNFAAVAEGFGVRGFRLEDPERCGATLDAGAGASTGRRWSTRWSTPTSRCCRPSAATPTSRTCRRRSRSMPERNEIERALTEEPAVTSLRD